MLSFEMSLHPGYQRMLKSPLKSTHLHSECRRNPVVHHVHIKWLKEYKTALNAEEGWLIHFTLSGAFSALMKVTLGDASIKVITISHSFD